MRRKSPSKEDKAFITAMRKASTAQQIHEAIMLLSDDPSRPLADEPTTLKELLLDIEGGTTEDGSEKGSI